MTTSSSFTSRPRAATSVAMSTMGSFLNLLRMNSRCRCSLSPCSDMALAPMPRSWRSSCSVVRFILAKTRTRFRGNLSSSLRSSPNFSYSVVHTKCCVTSVLATSSVEPTLMRMKSRWNLAAISWISFGHVAENMSVWRSGRICEQMARTCGSKPMSSMRSASSRTRYVTRSRLVLRICRKSMRRPGVAMRMWQPWLSCISCGPLGDPPKMHADLRWAGSTLRVSSSICCASSRVGASTRHMGPSPRSSGGCDSMWARAGTMKASVLPEPVLAMPTMSRHCPRMGHACAWIAVGAVNFCRVKAACTEVGILSGSCAKDVIGAGQSSPKMVMVCLARHSSASFSLSAATFSSRFLATSEVSCFLTFLDEKTTHLDPATFFLE
mmetsp:Transcript_26840/g.83014  ORF Transcript_26840/g.83014 Transcript_26840/m.83014 type:complete len:381 (+) Transcript_26840:651-1793(+)